MSDFFVCPDCGEDEYRVFREEDKVEETICEYCKHAGAECLLEGKPSCASCKMNRKTQIKSPAGSYRSDSSLSKPTKAIANSFAEQLKHGIKSKISLREDFNDSEVPSSPAIVHKRGESAVPADLLKGHHFLQKYVSGHVAELVLLYNSQQHGMSSAAFHSKCDDSKNGLIVIVSLTHGMQIAGFTWKGIRKGTGNANDTQLGGAVIKDGSFELFKFKNNIVFNVAEGIKFSSESDLYINFDDKSKCLCNFVAQFRGNSSWTEDIEDIKAYRLLAAE